MAVTINADNGVSSGSAGLKQTADSTGVLALQTNGTTAVTVDTSQNVGIGTSSFTHPFTVKKSNAGDWTCKFSNSSATGVSGFGYYDNSDTWKGYVGYDNGDANFLKLYATTSVGIKFITNTTERMRIDSSGNLLVNTTTAQTGAKLAVTGGIQGTIQSGTAVASTSGTSIDFTGIPSWVKRITVMFSGVSLSGTANPLIQIGAGSVTTSGYISSGAAVAGAGSTGMLSSTAGFVMNSSGAANVVSGHMVITTLGSNVWVSSHSAKYSTTFCLFGGGDITLGGALDRVRITTTNGTDTFDAGTINILYEG